MSDPFVSPTRSSRGPAAPAARPCVERLEDRVVPVLATAGVLLDQGAAYWFGEQRVPLLTRADQLAVALEPGRTDVLAALTGPAGPLAGLQLTRMLGPTLALLTDPGVVVGAESLAAAAAFEGVRAALPTYVNSQTGRWVIPTGEVVVALRPGVDPNATFGSDPAVATWRRLAGTPDQFLVSVAGSPLMVGERFRADPRFAWAAPNFYQDFQPTATDPLLSVQWHLRNSGQTGGASGADADVVSAWGVTSGDPSVTVAVLDNGVQLDHPDLAANIWINSGEIPGNSLDDDGNGWVDDVNGWDFVSSGPNLPSAGESHGTAVAGLIAAVANNGIGGAGVAPRSKVMPIRIAQGTTPVSDAAIAEAIYYAAGRTRDGLGTWSAAQVLNISWGGGGYSQVVRDALEWASSNGRGGKGAITFVATGNDFASSLSFPANLSGSIPGVVAVGASTDADVRAGYSNYGSGLDFLAPSSGGSFGLVTTDLTGAGGLNTNPGTAGDYTDTSASAFGGTSAASPIAAGIAALILALDGNLSAAAIRGLMRNTTEYIGPASITYDAVTGFHAQYGYGRVDAFAAVRGVGTREIQVLDGKDGRTDVPDDLGSVDMGTAAIGGGVTRIFRIRNQGTLPLTLGAITLSGPLTLVSGFGATTLNVGESTTFVIRFAPTAVGSAFGTVSFLTNDPDESPFNFTVFGTGYGASLSGFAYDDADGDGIRDPGEGGLAGRQIYLDANGNGSPDSGEPTTFTDGAGFYSFSGLAGGSYTIRQVLPAGWTWTGSFTGARPVSLPPGGSLVEQNFGQLYGSVVTGRIFEDRDADGVADGGEPGLVGWRVYLDTDNSGTYTPGEPETSADAQGNYRLQAPATSATLRLQALPGWRFTAPVSGAYAVTLNPGTVSPGRTFGVAYAAEILDVSPDPRIDPVEEITILFGQAVTGFDLADLTLMRDGLPVDLSGALLTGSGSMYLLTGLAGLTSPGGVYTLTLRAVGSGIVNGAGDPLSADATESWTTAHSVPLAYLGVVNPDPRTSPVPSIAIAFSEPVTGLDLSDFVLTRNGSPVSLAGVSLSGSGASYTLDGLAGLTANPGAYVLTLRAAGSGIVGALGLPLAGDATTGWTMYTAPATASFLPVIPALRTTPVLSITLVFSEPVVGLALSHFFLTRNGVEVPLTGATVTGAGIIYNLSGIATLTADPGQYLLALRATAAPLATLSGMPVQALALVGWQMVPDTPTPLPSGGSGTPVTPPPAPASGEPVVVPVPTPTVVSLPPRVIPESSLVVGADFGGSPLVKVIEPTTGKVVFEVMAYAPAFTGGVRVAVADVTGDGVPDLVTAAGFGGGPHVRIFDGVTGGVVQEFFAYAPQLTGGVYLAVADVTGDGVAEIITGAGPGGGPHVRIFDARSGTILHEFMAYDPALRTGVTIAAGDLDGDGVADIATGAGSHVRVFSGRTGGELRNFFAYDPAFSGGVSVALADVTGDGVVDLVTGAGPGGGPHVRVFDGRSQDVVQEFFAYEAAYTGGVRVAVADADGDGVADILTGTMAGGGPLVRAFRGQTGDTLDQLLVYDADFRGGLFIAGDS